MIRVARMAEDPLVLLVPRVERREVQFDVPSRSGSRNPAPTRSPIVSRLARRPCGRRTACPGAARPPRRRARRASGQRRADVVLRAPRTRARHGAARRRASPACCRRRSRRRSPPARAARSARTAVGPRGREQVAHPHHSYRQYADRALFLKPRVMRHERPRTQSTARQMCRSARGRATIPAWNRTGSTMSRPGSWKSPSPERAPRRQQRRIGHAAIAAVAVLALTGSLAAGASALTSTAQAPTRAAEKSQAEKGDGWYGKRDGKCRKGEGHRRLGGDLQLLGIRRRHSGRPSQLVGGSAAAQVRDHLAGDPQAQREDPGKVEQHRVRELRRMLLAGARRRRRPAGPPRRRSAHPASPTADDRRRTPARRAPTVRRSS